MDFLTSLLSLHITCKTRAAVHKTDKGIKYYHMVTTYLRQMKNASVIGLLRLIRDNFFIYIFLFSLENVNIDVWLQSMY